MTANSPDLGPRDSPSFPQQISLFAALLPERLSGRLGQRGLWLSAEGFFFTAVGLYLAHVVGIPQSGFFAIFLAAAGLTGRFYQLLDENRAAIYGTGVARRSPWSANGLTAFSVLTMFFGVFIAFALAAVWLGEARLHASFGFAVDSANLGTDTLRTRSFSSTDRLMIHNYLVLGTFFALSFIYGAYGALLAICWNACIWAMVLTTLVWRGLHATSAPSVAYLGVAVLAVLPHLVMEAASYIAGSLAAIFLSRAVVKYSLADPIFRSIGGSVLKLLGAAALGIALAAIVESTLPALVLPRF